MCEVNCDISTLLSLARVTYTCHLDDYNKTSQHDCQSRPLYWSFPPSPRPLDRLLAPGHLLGPAWKMSVGCLNLCALLAQMSVTITSGALLSLAWMSGLAPSCTLAAAAAAPYWSVSAPCLLLASASLSASSSASPSSSRSLPPTYTCIRVSSYLSAASLAPALCCCPCHPKDSPVGCLP